MKSRIEDRACALLVVVAHALEAKALLRRFELRLVQDKPFRLYANEKGLALIISGMGKVAAAAATAHACTSLCCEYDSARMPGLLNYGIAGHGACEVGASLMINKITDAGNGKSYYPTPLAGARAGTALLTVDTPELVYSEAVAYDMEAAGFWAAGSRMTEADRIQLLKLISDNPAQAADSLKPGQLTEFVAAAADPAAELIDELLDMNHDHIARHTLPTSERSIMNKLALTQTQQHQFRKLFFRYRALGRQHHWQQLTHQHREAGRLIQGLEAGLASGEIDPSGPDAKSPV